MKTTIGKLTYEFKNNIFVLVKDENFVIESIRGFKLVAYGRGQPLKNRLFAFKRIALYYRYAVKHGFAVVK